MKQQNSEPQNMEALVNAAAKKLGMQPAQLEKSLKSGDISRAIKNLPPTQANALTKALGDKAACEKLLSSPQAQALIKKLSGK